MNGLIKTHTFHEHVKVERRLENIGAEYVKTTSRPWEEEWWLPDIDKKGINQTAWIHLKAMFGGDIEMQEVEGVHE